MNNTKISKFLSLVLRHKPDAAHIELDEHGWVEIDTLLAGAAKAGKTLSREQLEKVVAESDKQRFVIDGDKIRANQGHSVEIDLELKPVTPPPVLYHGTVQKFLDNILAAGLKKMNRHHVHLSADVATAEKVGNRRGTAIILEIDSAAMANNGFEFMCSKNGVWLTEHVPANYINTSSI